MKKMYGIVSLIGSIIWCLAIFLRETDLISYDIIKQILGVAPNFGVVWMGIGFTDAFFPYVFKKDFRDGDIYILIMLILLVLILSEMIHDRFLNAPFDNADILTSIIAAVVFLVIRFFKKQSENKNT